MIVFLVNRTCTKTYNKFTLSFCKILTYFKTPVCGGLSCYFDASTGQCGGQCGNTVFETCVSKVENPNNDSHCACASSVASWTPEYNNSTNVQTINVATCDASTCYGNSCSFFYVSVDRQYDNGLYAHCNNDKYISTD